MQHEVFYVDLHIHTTFSDGALSPTEVVAYASKVGLSAISITDHDTVDGMQEAVDAGKVYGVEVIPGIELSAQENAGSQEMHILGYYIDWKSQDFNAALDVLKNARKQRAKTIFQNLKKSGIELDGDGLVENTGGKNIGRLHFAKALVEKKYVGSISEAFQKFLGSGRSAYVPKYFMSPKNAIEIIKKAGGIPVLAHPYYGRYGKKDIFKELINCGLMGIEAWHKSHPPNIVKKFLNMAEELNLIVTGGSDCHGGYGKEVPLMGRIKVPYRVVEELERAEEKIRNCCCRS